MRKMVEMDFEYLNYIPKAPVPTEKLYGQACSNDQITMSSWRKVWIDNTKANHERLGPFSKNHVGKYYNTNFMKPCIIAGSGPSLGNNIEELKKKRDIKLISCLHNFHYFEDNGIKPEMYVSLDAGEVTIEEITEGGKNPPSYYHEKTKDHTLACFIGSSPKLLETWKGEVVWFNAPIPDPGIMEELNKIEKFEMYISNGGNVLGACTYIAKAVMGSNPIAFVGSDFCFSYTKKFHPWESKYDEKLGHAIRAIDVFGNKVLTWGSYYNFKAWFDYICTVVPGSWVNCSEGGCMGAYPEGIIMQIKQMALKEFIHQYYINEQVEFMCKNPGDGKDPKTGQMKLLF